jgi:hypothetical protein
MAVDLAGTPSTGVRVQCGGDSHLVNFRGLATPERQVIFAINDLDETLPAPWEWDIKRLAASFVIACRDNGLDESTGEEAVLEQITRIKRELSVLEQAHAIPLINILAPRKCMCYRAISTLEVNFCGQEIFIMPMREHGMAKTFLRTGARS